MMVMTNRWSGAVLRPTVAAGLRLLLQQLLQKLGCVGNAHRTFAQYDTRAHALEQLAAGGTVAFLKLLHDLPHALHGLEWRKRSIPTHSGWLYPLTFDAGKGLKEA